MISVAARRDSCSTVGRAILRSAAACSSAPPSSPTSSRSSWRSGRGSVYVMVAVARARVYAALILSRLIHMQWPDSYFICAEGLAVARGGVPGPDSTPLTGARGCRLQVVLTGGKRNSIM